MEVTIKKLLSLVMCVALLTGCSNSAPEASPVYQQMAMSELSVWMDEHQDYILVDVRTQEEFLDGHIPGAVNLPVEAITQGDVSTLPDKGQTTLVYCRSGVRSKQAADSLLAQGYLDVIDCGGILDWPGPVVNGS